MEKKLKATPGPWLHRAKSDSVHMPPPEQPYIYGEIIFAFSEYRTPSNENLALILAAPDLYAVLSELEESSEYWSEYSVPLGIVERIKSALKKARGEQ